MIDNARPAPPFIIAFCQMLLSALLLISSNALSQAGSQPGSAAVSSAAPAIAKIVIRTPKWEEIFDGEWKGIYGDTMKAVFEPEGIEIEVIFTPYEASIAKVQEKQCDVAMSVYMDEYPGVLYPRWPQEYEQTVAVHLSTTPYASEQDFLGKSTAWLRGYGFEQFLPKGIQYREVRTEVLGLRMVERGSVDYFIDYRPTIEAAAKDGDVDLGKMRLSPVRALVRPVYPIFRDDDRGRAIMAIYDRRMAELHADGTLDRLFREYDYTDRYVPPAD